MNGQRSVGVYRFLLRLYPEKFREEYGPDMVLLLTHQLREEPAARVLSRVVADLALSLPTIHLETRMKRPSSSATTIAFAALGTAALTVAIIGGSSAGMLVIGLSVAAASGALSVLAWRQARAITNPQPVTAHWWKLFGGGALTLAGVIIATSMTGEVSGGLWIPMMIVIALAISALAAGSLLGVVRLNGRHSHNVAR